MENILGPKRPLLFFMVVLYAIIFVNKKWRKIEAIFPLNLSIGNFEILKNVLLF